jgi:NAD(P)-dependent dehydrogenase (short-subunit alcohol dehydrogenase family)
MPTALITGANRGIGLALATCYAAVPAGRVIAITRDTGHSEPLAALVDGSAGSVRAVRADMSDAAAIASLGTDLRGETIDLLVNNAGIAGSNEFGAIAVQDLVEVFGVNTFAPLLLTQALKPLLAQGGKVVNISSTLGSMKASSERADALIYSMSKAALNMFSIKLAMLLRPLEIVVVAMHPGGVRTRLGGRGAPLSAKSSAEMMLRVINSVDLEQSGAYLACDGSAIPW